MTVLSATTATTSDWVRALRATQERLVAVASDLDEKTLAGPSYDTEWTVGQVLSHLGSGAQIFGLYLEAGLAGTEVPGMETIAPIWDDWNARDDLARRDGALVTNEALVSRIEGLSADTVEAFGMSLFGMDIDLGGFVRLRLSEHEIHTWDVAVQLDPTATIAPEVVDLLVDGLGQTAAWAAKPSDADYTVRIDTTEPSRSVLVTVGAKTSITSVTPDASDDGSDGQITLPAEGFLRLVYGRLDPDHTPTIIESGSRGVADLRQVFQGL